MEVEVEVDDGGGREVDNEERGESTVMGSK